MKGRGKGPAFERWLSVQLSLWVSHGKRRDVFWRTSMSGGRATVFKKQGIDLSHQAGDIGAIHPLGHALTKRFFIEAKHYKNLQIDNFLLKQKGTLWKFWLKACKEARAHNREPFLVARQNGKPTLLITLKGALLTICDPSPAALSSYRLPNVYLFDEVMKTRFRPLRKMPIRRLSEKEIERIVNDEPPGEPVVRGTP
jgi:hypothetical protein